MAFNLSDALANKEDNSNKDGQDSTNKDGIGSFKVPREYKMVLSKVEQSMGVFSEGPGGYILRMQNVLMTPHPQDLKTNSVQFGGYFF